MQAADNVGRGLRWFRRGIRLGDYDRQRDASVLAGMTGEQLAEKAHIDPSTPSRLEKSGISARVRAVIMRR